MADTQNIVRTLVSWWCFLVYSCVVRFILAIWFFVFLTILLSFFTILYFFYVFLEVIPKCFSMLLFVLGIDALVNVIYNSLFFKFFLISGWIVLIFLFNFADNSLILWGCSDFIMMKYFRKIYFVISVYNEEKTLTNKIDYKRKK